MEAPAKKTNLLGLATLELESYFEGLGEKPFHARQLLQWMHQRRVTDFDLMTNLSKRLRTTLKSCAKIEAPAAISESQSADGTIKWLFESGSGQAVETVFIPEAARGTLCISSQVGCALDCAFCATGAQGFSRNLTTGEIIGQVWLAAHALGHHKMNLVVAVQKLSVQRCVA